LLANKKKDQISATDIIHDILLMWLWFWTHSAVALYFTSFLSCTLITNSQYWIALPAYIALLLMFQRIYFWYLLSLFTSLCVQQLGIFIHFHIFHISFILSLQAYNSLPLIHYIIYRCNPPHYSFHGSVHCCLRIVNAHQF